jgi:hypothetical protein
LKKRAPATEAASPAGSAPPDCADSSTFSATLALPLAVAAASAEAVLALGAEMVNGTWRGGRVGAGRGAGRGQGERRWREWLSGPGGPTHLDEGGGGLQASARDCGRRA